MRAEKTRSADDLGQLKRRLQTQGSEALLSRREATLLISSYLLGPGQVIAATIKRVRNTVGTALDRAMAKRKTPHFNFERSLPDRYCLHEVVSWAAYRYRNEGISFDDLPGRGGRAIIRSTTRVSARGYNFPDNLPDCHAEIKRMTLEIDRLNEEVRQLESRLDKNRKRAERFASLK